MNRIICGILAVYLVLGQMTEVYALSPRSGFETETSAGVDDTPGALKSLLVEEITWIPAEISALERYIRNTKSDQRITGQTKGVEYTVYTYRTDDEAGKMARRKKIAGAFNVVIEEEKKGRWCIFIEESLKQDRDGYQQALSHEVYEIVWKKQLKDNEKDLKETFKVSVDRAAHILAWAWHIVTAKPKSVDDMGIIKRLIANLDARGLDILIKQYNKREAQHDLIKAYLEAEKLQKVEAFEKSVYEYCRKIQRVIQFLNELKVDDEEEYKEFITLIYAVVNNESGSIGISEVDSTIRHRVLDGAENIKVSTIMEFLDNIWRMDAVVSEAIRESGYESIAMYVGHAKALAVIAGYGSLLPQYGGLRCMGRPLDSDVVEAIRKMEDRWRSAAQARTVRKGTYIIRTGAEEFSLPVKIIVERKMPFGVTAWGFREKTGGPLIVVVKKPPSYLNEMDRQDYINEAVFHEVREEWFRLLGVDNRKAHRLATYHQIGMFSNRDKGLTFHHQLQLSEMQVEKLYSIVAEYGYMRKNRFHGTAVYEKLVRYKAKQLLKKKLEKIAHVEPIAAINELHSLRDEKEDREKVDDCLGKLRGIFRERLSIEEYAAVISELKWWKENVDALELKVIFRDFLWAIGLLGKRQRDAGRTEEHVLAEESV